jgi:hypothetical protein
MKRTLIFLYGVTSYLVFFATFLYAVGFIGNLWVPKTLDSPRETALGNALLIDLGLLALFAVQHSVMARPAFKRWWTGIIPAAAERSTYVLFSSLALILLFYFWQPLGGSIWSMTSSAAWARTRPGTRASAGGARRGRDRPGGTRPARTGGSQTSARPASGQRGRSGSP